MQQRGIKEPSSKYCTNEISPQRHRDKAFLTFPICSSVSCVNINREFGWVMSIRICSLYSLTRDIASRDHWLPPENEPLHS